MRLVHPANLRRSFPARPFCAWSSILCLALLACLGCTRNFYRQRADQEVDRILAEKDKYPQWAIEQYHVYPDPRARFADPTNPNRPPMPPDDPAARNLSPNPQRPGKAGVGYIEGSGYLDLLEQWNAQNRARQPESALRLPALDLRVGRAKVDYRVTLPFLGPIEFTGERESLPQAPAYQAGLDERTESGFRLNLEQAVELGLINSREYQNQRENLYLAALPVTQERFAFSAQWFAIEEALREWTGRDTPEGQGNHWVADSTVGFTRRFASGALLLVQFANQAVFEFANTGGRPTISESVLSFDLLQPLLRGGGFAVTLEALTQAERNLLYQIRRYARFREEFYVAIAGGGNIGGGADVPPGFENLDLTQQVFQSNAGYYPVILRAGQLANEVQNLIHLEEIFRLFQAFAQGGDITQLQVEQIEQQLLETRITVLDRQVAYGSALDRFKIQLGLPTDLKLDLEDSILRELADLLRRFVLTLNQAKKARKDLDAFGTSRAPRELRPFLRRMFRDAEIVQHTRFRDEFPARWRQWEQRADAELRQLLRQTNLDRQRLWNEQTDLEQRAADLRDKGERLTALEQKRLKEMEARLGELGPAIREAELQLDAGRFEQALRSYEGLDPQHLGEQLGVILGPAPRFPLAYLAWVSPLYLLAQEREENRLDLFRQVLQQFELLLDAPRSERIEQIRAQWPRLPPVVVGGVDLVASDLEQAFAVAGQFALSSRFDLMNARAELVDAWRQIAVSANALLGVFNVRYHADLLSPLDQAKPFALGGSGYRQQLFLSGELPLVRLPERNQYRAALIAFQRARRRVMALEDRILADVRSELRQLRNVAENYRIGQRAVELAYRQVENSLETFQAPAEGGQAARGSAASAAALTQQLLNALRSLPRAQNQLYANWVQYHITRLQLFRDLELMPLDERGVWIDDLTLDPACRPAGPFESDLPEPRRLPPAPSAAPEGKN